ncbi:hypothetical protein FI667_g6485, partial [Globisporangium splendens]
MGTNASSEKEKDDKKQEVPAKPTVHVEEHVESSTDEHGVTTTTKTITTTTVHADGTTTTTTTTEQEVDGAEVLEEISTDEEVVVTESEEKYVSVSASSAVRGAAAASGNVVKTTTSSNSSTSKKNQKQEEQDDEEMLTVATTVTDFESVSEGQVTETTTTTSTSSTTTTTTTTTIEGEETSVYVSGGDAGKDVTKTTVGTATSSEPEIEPIVYFDEASAVAASTVRDVSVSTTTTTITTTTACEEEECDVLLETNGANAAVMTEESGRTVNIETMQVVGESGEIIETIVTTTTTSATTTISEQSAARYDSLTVYGTTRKSFKKWLFQFILYVKSQGKRFENLTIVELFVFARLFCRYYLLERRVDWISGGESITMAHKGAWEMARALTFFSPVVFPIRRRYLRSGGKGTVILDEITVRSTEISDYISIHRCISKWLQKIIVISLVQENAASGKETAVILHDGELIFSGHWAQVVAFVERMGCVCPPRRDVANLLLGFESGKLDYSYGSIVEHVKRYENRRAHKFAVLFRLADDVVLTAGAPVLPARSGEEEGEEYSSTRLQIVDGGSFRSRSRRSVTKRKVRTGNSSRRSTRSQHGEAEKDESEEIWVRRGKSKSGAAASYRTTETKRSSQRKTTGYHQSGSGSSSSSSSSSSSDSSDSSDGGARHQREHYYVQRSSKRSSKKYSTGSDESCSSDSDQEQRHASHASSVSKKNESHSSSSTCGAGDGHAFASETRTQSSKRGSVHSTTTSSSTSYGYGSVSVSDSGASSTEYSYDSGIVSAVTTGDVVNEQVFVEEKDGVKTTTTTKTVINAEGLEETITTVTTEVNGESTTTTTTETSESSSNSASYGAVSVSGDKTSSSSTSYGYGSVSVSDSGASSTEYSYDSGIVSAVTTGDVVNEQVFVEEKDGVKTTTTTKTVINAEGLEETITTVTTEVNGESTTTTTTETSESSSKLSASYGACPVSVQDFVELDPLRLRPRWSCLTVGASSL